MPSRRSCKLPDFTVIRKFVDGNTRADALHCAMRVGPVATARTIKMNGGLLILRKIGKTDVRLFQIIGSPCAYIDQERPDHVTYYLCRHSYR